MKYPGKKKVKNVFGETEMRWGGNEIEWKKKKKKEESNSGCG